MLAAVLSVIAGAAVLLRPPAAISLAEDGPAHVRGVLHVHTRLSDGSGTPEQVAAAAARAGLQFVILTDHGDATRRPESPRYLNGVLCIDAVEVTTHGGHVVALGLTDRAPYPLGGEPRDVVTDIARLGGMSIAAHPASPRESLQWTDWDAPVDGLEWLNADSEWRDEPPSSIARALFTYPWRPVETMARLLDRPAGLLDRWDRLLRERPVVAVAAADAHASIPLSGPGDRFGDGRMLPIPRYEPLFRTFSIVLPDLALTGDAAFDAAAVVEAIRAGRVYSAIDGFASPPRLTFTATSGTVSVGSGEALPLAGPVTVAVRTNAPGGAAITLLGDGVVVARASGAHLDFVAPAIPAVYRVEVHLGADSVRAEARAPWLVSNAIRVGMPSPPLPRPSVVRSRTALYTDGQPRGGVAIEKNDASQAGTDVVTVPAGGTRLQMRFALGRAEGEGSHVSFVLPSGKDIAGYERLTFRARADKPMRLWVQLRPTRGGPDHTWRRSVYLDTDVRTVSVPFSEMRPVPASAPPQPSLAGIEAVMFVIDGVHTALGTTGTFWIDDVVFER